MIPVFGTVFPGIAYRDRPGAYALILNPAGELAIVHTPMGHFLPGGGLDPGESHREALARELDEEIGFRVVSARELGVAMQYHYSVYYREHFRKIGVFFLVEASGSQPPRLQAEHSLSWWPRARAERELSQEFQRWSVGLLPP